MRAVQATTGLMWWVWSWFCSLPSPLNPLKLPMSELHSSSYNPHTRAIMTIIIPLLQIRKLRYRTRVHNAQGCSRSQQATKSQALGHSATLPEGLGLHLRPCYRERPEQQTGMEAALLKGTAEHQELADTGPGSWERVRIQARSPQP